jgi:hypothetical protein
MMSHAMLAMATALGTILLVADNTNRPSGTGTTYRGQQMGPPDSGLVPVIRGSSHGNLEQHGPADPATPSVIGPASPGGGVTGKSGSIKSFEINRNR